MSSVQIVRDVVRDLVDETPPADLIEKRSAEGWKLIALEWERPSQTDSSAVLKTTEIPYGLRVADDCHSLEESPTEVEVLKTMLEMFVEDRSFGEVAETLNEQGYRDRAGHEWTQVSIFQLVPRLVEVGPDVFGSEEWSKTRHLRRQRLAAV